MKQIKMISTMLFLVTSHLIWAGELHISQGSFPVDCKDSRTTEELQIEAKKDAISKLPFKESKRVSSWIEAGGEIYSGGACRVRQYFARASFVKANEAHDPHFITFNSVSWYQQLQDRSITPEEIVFHKGMALENGLKEAAFYCSTEVQVRGETLIYSVEETSNIIGFKLNAKYDCL